MVHERIAPMRIYNPSNNTRRCKKCKTWLDLSLFSSRVRYPSPTTKDSDKKVPTLYYRSECKKCSLKEVNIEKYCGREARKDQHKKDPRKVMLMHARLRALKKGLSFNIDYTDIVIPDKCPLLNIPLFVTSKQAGPNSPTIDRIICEKGYIKGNVLVISHKANTAKNNLTLKELELLVSNLKRVLNKQGELLEHPITVCEDNQQPSLSRNTLEGSTTNSRIQTDNAEDSNGNTSALPS